MAQDKLKIFISYSRKDCAAFAEDLLAGLELLGFAPFLDLHDIAAGEDWEVRLEGLIQSADTMVYAISPQAVKSGVCAWEVDKAVELGKRIIPIVALPVTDADVPEALKRLNYIFFDKPHSYARALSQLSQALKTDLDWIREHTRLSELASRWEIREKLDAQLLRGPELEAANAWMAGWNAGAPDVPDNVRKFMRSSSDAETARANKERQQLEAMAKAQAAQAEALAEQEVAVQKLSRRTTMGLITAGVLTTAAGGLAWWGNDAERRFRSARKAADEAEKNSIEAAIEKEAARTDITGQLNAFAASPGQVALANLEGDQLSIYSKQLLHELKNRDVSFLSACMRTSQAVRKKSMNFADHEQRPYLSSDLNGEIYLQRHGHNAQMRVAITISVDNHGDLPTSNRNIAAWSTFLKNNCGFEVKQLKNPGLRQFRKVVTEQHVPVRQQQGSFNNPLLHKAGFSSRTDPSMTARPNTLLVFIFAGSGVLHNGIDYLVTGDVNIAEDKFITKDMIPFREIQTAMREHAAASILILDTQFEKQSSQFR